jgi:hypothetical protein
MCSSFHDSFPDNLIQGLLVHIRSLLQRDAGKAFEAVVFVARGSAAETAAAPCRDSNGKPLEEHK